MATKKRGVKIDENETERLTSKLGGKNEGPARPLRRAALGELGNRVLRSSVNTTKEAQGKLPDLKNVKPRVDTRWKKAEVVKPKPPGKIAAVQKFSKVEVVKVELPKLKSPAKVAPLAQPEDFNHPESHSNSLLSHVIDIDADDDENLIHMTEYVNDVYEYLRTLEEKFPVQSHYLANHADVTPRMRFVLVDWINEVHYQFNLVPETYHMSVALIDRYLQVSKTLTRKMLQLVGITSLFLAGKYEEIMPPSIHDYIHVSDNTYTEKQVKQMEMSMLRKLKFNLGRPLPIHFLRRFSKAALATDCIHGAAKYFLELISIEYSLVHWRPSLAAATAIYLALRLLRPTEETWTPTLEHYTKYREEQLQEPVKELARVVLDVASSKFQSVFKKYASSKQRGISKMQEMSCGVIEEIAS